MKLERDNPRRGDGGNAESQDVHIVKLLVSNRGREVREQTK